MRYKGLIDCLYSIARTEGVPGLYKGLTPSLLLVSHILFSSCYENLKSLARGEGGAIFALENGGKKNNDDGIAPTSEQRELTSAECGVYGMLSKIVASLITYPQQVVPRMQKLQIERNQIKYKSLLQSFGTISRREGISGMYKGMVPNLARMLPSTGVTFSPTSLSTECLLKARTRTTTRTRRVYVALKKSEAGVIDTKG